MLQLSFNNRGDLNVMVITLRRILATLVSLVIALARESLYKEEFLDLDLEGSQFLNEEIH